MSDDKKDPAEKPTMKVRSIYDHGKGYKHEDHKGEFITLWGVIFENDGKGFKATIDADDAKAMIEAGRAKKA